MYDSKVHPNQVWYDQEPDEAGNKHPVHERLFPHVQQLEEDQRDIHLQNALNAKLYTNREPMAFSWNADYTASFRPLNNNLENVIQSVVDTLGSRMSTNRPKATIVSRGADFGCYLRSRQLDKFLWGEFVHHKLHRKMDRVFIDACVYGTGALKIDLDGNEVFCERVHPDELVVDQRECVSDEMPMQLHQRKVVSRLWLLKTYGKDDVKVRKAILEAQTKNFHYTSYRSPQDEQIVVIESWKLPTRPGAGDGRHAICIENCTLKDEPYTRDRFPFVFIKYAEPEFGFYGRSLVCDLMGYQIRLNELNEVIRYGQDVMCVPRVMVEQGSNVNAQQFDNQIGKIVKYRGVKPEALTWNAFNAEIYNERDRIRSSAFEFAGISQLSAQARLPSQARLDSSDALREYNAIEDQRFNRQFQNQEEAYKEAASHLIELNARLYRSQKVSRKSTYRTRSFVEQIDWKHVDMEADKYVLEISASSIINMTPAARKDKLNEWLQLDVITPEQYKAWSGNPDLEAISNELSASSDYIHYHIEKMLAGEPMTPDPLMNLAEGFHVVHQTYQHIRTLDTPDEIVDLFVNWLEMAQEEMAPEPEPMVPGMEPGMEAGMMPPGAAPGMDPMAAGGAPPMAPGAAPAPMGGMV